MLEDETLFDVVGYESLFWITKSGVVISKPRLVNSPICGGSRRIAGKVLSPQLVRGYPAIQPTIGGVRKTLYIHRALAELFIPNPGNRREVNHIDGDRANHSIDNLEWCTHRENMAHAFRTGLAKKPKTGPGEDSPSAKLNNESVRDIKRRLQRGETHKSIARVYGVAPGTIGFISCGATWSHISI